MGVKSKTNARKSVNPHSSDVSPIPIKKRKSGSGAWDVDPIVTDSKVNGNSKPQNKTVKKELQSSEPVPKKQMGEGKRKRKPTKVTKSKPVEQPKETLVTESEPVEQPKETLVTESEPVEQPKETLVTESESVKQEKETTVKTKKFRKSNDFPGWLAGDLLLLIGRIEDNSSKFLSLESSQAVNKLDWEEISFKEHDAAQCKDAWIKLQEKSRSPRELVQEAQSLVLEKIQEHPDYAKITSGQLSISSNSKSKAKVEKNKQKLEGGEDADDSEEAEDKEEEVEDEEEEDEEDEGEAEDEVEEGDELEGEEEEEGEGEEDEVDSEDDDDAEGEDGDEVEGEEDEELSSSDE